MNGSLLVATFVVVAGMVGAILGIAGTSDDDMRLALRLTAWTSLALFLAAFVASSLQRLWRTSVSTWLLRNRRSLGVAFAISHSIHLALIAARVAGHSDAFWQGRTLASMIPGAIAYAFIAAMALTSFDRPARWLGRGRWKILHKVGVYVIWVIFVGAEVGRLGGHVLGVLPLAALALALVLRMVARVRLLAGTRRVH